MSLSFINHKDNNTIEDNLHKDNDLDPTLKILTLLPQEVENQESKDNIKINNKLLTAQKQSQRQRRAYIPSVPKSFAVIFITSAFALGIVLTAFFIKKFNEHRAPLQSIFIKTNIANQIELDEHQNSPEKWIIHTEDQINNSKDFIKQSLSPLSLAKIKIKPRKYQYANRLKYNPINKPEYETNSVLTISPSQENNESQPILFDKVKGSHGRYLSNNSDIHWQGDWKENNPQHNIKLGKGYTQYLSNIFNSKFQKELNVVETNINRNSISKQYQPPSLN